MTTLNMNDAYEKAIVGLALRQFAETCFRNAVIEFGQNHVDEGNTMKERGEKASELAIRIGS